MFIADLDGETQYTSEDLSWADRDSYRFVRRISTDKRTSSDRPIAGEKPTIRSGCNIEC
jgi:hypothetical protein